jgi:hypothetical protein
MKSDDYSVRFAKIVFTDEEIARLVSTVKKDKCDEIDETILQKLDNAKDELYR